MFISMKIETILVFGGTKNTAIGGLEIVNSLVKIGAIHTFSQATLAQMRENWVIGINLGLIESLVVMFLTLVSIPDIQC